MEIIGTDLSYVGKLSEETSPTISWQLKLGICDLETGLRGFILSVTSTVALPSILGTTNIARCQDLLQSQIWSRANRLYSWSTYSPKLSSAAAAQYMDVRANKWQLFCFWGSFLNLTSCISRLKLFSKITQRCDFLWMSFVWVTILSKVWSGC